MECIVQRRRRVNGMATNTVSSIDDHGRVRRKSLRWICACADVVKSREKVEVTGGLARALALALALAMAMEHEDGAWSMEHGCEGQA